MERELFKMKKRLRLSLLNNLNVVHLLDKRKQSLGEAKAGRPLPTRPKASVLDVTRAFNHPVYHTARINTTHCVCSVPSSRCVRALLLEGFEAFETLDVRVNEPVFRTRERGNSSFHGNLSINGLVHILLLRSNTKTEVSSFVSGRSSTRI